MKLTEALDKLDLTDIYRKFHPKAKEYTFFSTTQYLLQNQSYNWSQDRSQPIQEDRTNPLHHIRSLWSKSSLQQQ